MVGGKEGESSEHQQNHVFLIEPCGRQEGEKRERGRERERDRERERERGKKML